MQKTGQTHIYYNSNSMPSVIIQVDKDLKNKYLNCAPTTNQDKPHHVINIYKNGRHAPKHIVERTDMTFYITSAFGRVRKRGKPGQ